jgi:hypothetical protein
MKKPSPSYRDGVSPYFRKFVASNQRILGIGDRQPDVHDFFSLILHAFTTAAEDLSEDDFEKLRKMVREEPVLAMLEIALQEAGAA